MVKENNVLIKITEQNGKQAVSARELHAFLESKQDFSTWIKNRIEKYDFVENQDYSSFHNIVEREIGASKRIEYALTLDMAKELAMVEGNERGKQARRYFIECEKKLKEKSLSPLEILKHQVYLMEQQELRIKEVENKILLVESKMITKDETYFTISGYANLDKKKVDRSLAVKLAKQCSSICNTRKLHIGKEYDAKYGQVNTYPSTILKEVFDNYFKN